MEKYIIAGIKVGMETHDGKLRRQAQEYLSDFEGEPEIKIALTDEFILKKQQENPHLSFESCEYIWSCFDFCSKMLDFDGFMLHASAVAYENKAYVFSAPSGTGKSTHTALWQKVFGEEKARIINDDKPAIKLCDDEILVCGTPWSGKTDKNKNIAVPLGGICFLERGNENEIKELTPKDAIYKILNQTLRPLGEENMVKLLELINKVLIRSKAYSMKCNISDEAAIVAYEKMSGKRTL